MLKNVRFTSCMKDLKLGTLASDGQWVTTDNTATMSFTSIQSEAEEKVCKDWQDFFKLWNFSPNI